MRRNEARTKREEGGGSEIEHNACLSVNSSAHDGRGEHEVNLPLNVVAHFSTRRYEKRRVPRRRQMRLCGCGGGKRAGELTQQ